MEIKQYPFGNNYPFRGLEKFTFSNFCVIARSAFQRRSNLLRLKKIASPKKQARNDTKNLTKNLCARVLRLGLENFIRLQNTTDTVGYMNGGKSRAADIGNILIDFQWAVNIFADEFLAPFRFPDLIAVGFEDRKSVV